MIIFHLQEKNSISMIKMNLHKNLSLIKYLITTKAHNKFMVQKVKYLCKIHSRMRKILTKVSN